MIESMPAPTSTVDVPPQAMNERFNECRIDCVNQMICKTFYFSLYFSYLTSVRMKPTKHRRKRRPLEEGKPTSSCYGLLLTTPSWYYLRSTTPFCCYLLSTTPSCCYMLWMSLANFYLFSFFYFHDL